MRNLRTSPLFIFSFLTLFTPVGASHSINAASPPYYSSSAQDQRFGATENRDPEGDAVSLEVIALYKQGRYDEALLRAQVALSAREKAFGKSHELYAAALYNLATIQLALTQHENARKSFEQTVKIQEACGADAEQLCNSLDKLANASYAVGRTIDARKALEREIALREATDGPESLLLIAPLKNLAQVYEYQGEYEKSAQLHDRRTRLFEKDFQRKTSPTAQEKIFLVNAWEDCACAWRQARKKKEAQYAGNALERLSGKKLFFFNTDEKYEDASVRRGKATKTVLPAYPQSARAMGVSGDVIVRFDIDETGSVTDVKIQCGHPLLRQASEAAAREWRFKPTLVDGKPESVIGFATFRFLAPPGVKTKVR
jgi:TonB family protein